MANCAHCGTGFSPRSEGERFCCRGCEFVAELITEQGFDQFYDLKQGVAVTPVRSRPFEEHDFSWLAPQVASAEGTASARHEPARLDLGLEGVSCVGCVWLIEKLFARHPGAIRAAAHPAGGRLHLEWEPGRCDLEAFLRELCQFGYVAAPAGSATSGHERRRLAARLGLCGAFALNTMGFSLPVYLDMPPTFEFAALFKLIAFLSATLSMLVGGGYFIDRAWRAARSGSLHIDLPIALGLVSAYGGSIFGWAIDNDELMYFDFVSTFVFLMLAGRFLQTAAVDRNRRRLMRQQPVPEALPRSDESGGSIALADLEPGACFLLGPGQALPVSGILTSDEADFSLEWIHGEADPVRFAAGSRLPAGAILLSRGAVAVEASERWSDSLLARLTAAPSADRGSPGLERLLRTYLWVVLGLGLAAWLGWGLSGKWLTGLQSMISVFVISCPCALGVAIPLADDLAASAMARLGVFVRSATVWPRLRRIRHVIFDKTGTLTLERPVLENPDAVAGLDDESAVALARLTRGSLHPVSRSLLEALGGRGQKLLAHSTQHPQVREFPGLGVTLESDGVSWSLGKAGWSGQGGHPIDAVKPDTELRRNGLPVAAFHFRESLRPEATTTVRWLAEAGLSLHILSGDHPEKVRQIAVALGLPEDQSAGGLDPIGKAARVRELDRQDTLYLGDGANDALAFDAALVTGTPVVDRSLLESKADFYTLGSGLGFLPGLLGAAETRCRAVRTAFAFALAYNLTTVAFSMAGRMNPLLAAILMPLSSVISILLVAGISRVKTRIRG